jgi:hypothetical protein
VAARLAYGGGVQGFFVGHRGHHYASTALMDPMPKTRAAQRTGPPRTDIASVATRARIAPTVRQAIRINSITALFEHITANQAT